MLRDWKWTLIAVALLIVLSTLCTLAMTLFTRTLIDGYILPLTEAAVPDFSPLAGALLRLAAVLFVGVLASFLFGGLYILHMYIPSGMNLAVKELYKMLPYVVTTIVLVITSMQNRRENQPPASLGLPYFREER